MDIMELGAIGELVGGMAVIASLVYVGLQVRQGNQAVTRDSYRSWVSELNRVLLQPQQDPEFTELFQQANRDWASLSLRDQGVMSATYSQVLSICEQWFTESENGEVNPHLNRQLDAVAATFLQMPGPAAWWEQVSPTFYADSFCNHIAQLLSSQDCPPPLDQVLPWYATPVGEA